jgi:NAD(P)-dependent dehydrogenase (short-subunit alcohol dehydrogenase family)
VLARANCNVAILDIGQSASEGVNGLRSEHSVKVEYYPCDVSSKVQVNEVISRIEQDFGRIDINVNAAGVVKDEPFLTISEENIDRTFGINFKGSFFVAQACAASIVRRLESASKPVDPAIDGGSIVFIGSISTHIPSMAQNISAYVASKDAVRGLVKPLAVELASYGIRT